MGKFHHLLPQERQELVQNIVDKLKPQMAQFVQQSVGEYAVTDKDAQREIQNLVTRLLDDCRKQIEKSADAYLLALPRPKWWARFLFTTHGA